ncbi:scarecrow-like protein 9 [Phoenix dactylifera]|uniref:Scarecrow-like protein 9 n=1 Tax=Phoenix dactylifera TaxID=42345 RepID=A0A8B8J2K9_PHODC|nr:scarecrow-like protein 9 [Phoenix dactylifera]XP_026659271.2 scarecrow-like protein 9 [Phoenix dactylifera]
MVPGTRIRDLRGMTSGFKYEHLLGDQNSVNSLKSGGPPILDQKGFIDLPSVPHNSTLPGPTSSILTTNANASSSSLITTAEMDPAEDAEIFSDIVLSYISQMLMEEDIDEKFEHPALLAAEKPFYDILAENSSPSSDQPPPPPFSSQSSDSPDDSANNNQYGSSSGGVINNLAVDDIWPYDSLEYQQLQTHPVSVDYSSRSSFYSGSVVEGLDESFGNTAAVPDLLSGSQLPAWEQFRRGAEEARKFLPSEDKFAINLEANGFSFPRELEQENGLVEVKAEEEEREYLSRRSRGRKNPHGDDLELEEGRSNKQSAVFPERTVRTEMFDRVLLYTGDPGRGPSELRAAMQKEASRRSQSGQSKGSGGGKGRVKRQPKREVVDLRTILIHCAQAVAIDDRRNAHELLKQIRQHSSPYGDATQRLAQYFADGLEARLAGTGSEIYNSLVAKRRGAADILKAHHLYMSACPFKKISHFFSNQTILDVAEKATRVHIVDYGIYYGFQWPCFLQRLSARAGGPPRLRITGIDEPQPGFRPTERIEETGRRLADYCRSFDIPFEFHAIAAKWETVRVEDLNIDKDEVLVVTCLHQFKNLMDETVVVDSPRNMVLNTIRKMNPVVFIHAIVNGAYSAPFFVTRFREALFHFSALFDMLETNVPREDAQRQLIERDLFGKEILNVISCEGLERVERPETFKQWQVRILRAGFTQLPLNRDIVKKAKEKVKMSYHKDFVVDEGSRWLLQGWKGRIIYALSSWKPNDAT